MPKPQEILWPIEPHTLAKHEILRRYLGAWFAILGSKIQRIMYLDGFCGPGRYAGGEPGSPLIALHTAMSHKERLKQSKLFFFFIDEREDRIAHLEYEISQLEIPPNFKIIIRTGEFQTILAEVFDVIEDKSQKLIPTFAFIDPFGFSGVPFDLVQRLLSMPMAEVFITVMLRDANRFAEHPDPTTQQYVVDLFGTPEVLKLIKTSGNRLLALMQLYQTQLLQHAQFVRFFEMCDQRDQIIYYLYFAGNHPLGHKKMKDAFWKVDSSSGLKFSDATNPNQLILFDLDPTDDLAKILHNQFCGQKILSENVIKYVEDETPYISKHARSALKILEQNERIIIDAKKMDGTIRRKGYFAPGTIINF
jgi:three-Cys-motif partner protein